MKTPRKNRRRSFTKSTLTFLFSRKSHQRRTTSSKRRHRRRRHLPEEIVQQILTKLPTKSILKFKLVSKSWRRLISSDHFVKAHLEESSKYRSLERHHITFGTPSKGAKKTKFSLPSFMSRQICSCCSRSHNPADAAAEDFDYPTCTPEDSALIVGSCNGLLCVLKNDADFILWNPTTGKFRELPPVFDRAELDYLTVGGSPFRACVHGFGFDESDGDYKVLAVWKRGLRHDVEQKLVAKAYSSKADSWRRVEDPTVLDWSFGYLPEGRLAGGKLHWVVFGLDESVIISFDLKDETFGAVRRWPGGLDCEWLLSTHTIDGRLCCFSPDIIGGEPDRIDYWVQEEEEVGGSRGWRKLATLGRPPRAAGEIERGDEYYNPLFVGPGGGDVLAQRYGTFVLFTKGSDGGGGYPRNPKVVDRMGHACRATIYVESLVEP